MWFTLAKATEDLEPIIDLRERIIRCRVIKIILKGTTMRRMAIKTISKET